MIEDKLSKCLFQKRVYHTGGPSHESGPRSGSLFQKGWDPWFRDFSTPPSDSAPRALYPLANLGTSLVYLLKEKPMFSKNLVCHSEHDQALQCDRDLMKKLTKVKFYLVNCSLIFLMFIVCAVFCYRKMSSNVSFFENCLKKYKPSKASTN